jgi:hypothetical protein
MPKDEIPPLPLHPPKKRKQMYEALDIHLAMWAHNATLAPSEKRRVNEERQRRKRLRRSEKVGLLVGKEGITPEQFVRMAEVLNGEKGAMNEIWHAPVSGAVHSLCKSYGVDVEVVRPPRMEQADIWKIIVKNSTKVIAFPRGEDGPVWDLIRYTRHRNTPVTIIMPNGERR